VSCSGGEDDAAGDNVAGAMKPFVATTRGVFGLALVACGLAACSDAAPSGPAPGVATVGFAPRPLALPYTTLSRARVQLDRVLVIGNIPPPPPGTPPPPNRPPPDRPPLPNVDLDALSAGGASASIHYLPQGLYSRVRFTIGRISLEGRARGTVFHVSLAPFGVIVDVLASMPQELGLDQDVNFEVSVDPNLWFPPYLFDGAMRDNRDEIVADEVSNPQIAAALIPAMTASFWLP
jgi:hypothetical protein